MSNDFVKLRLRRNDVGQILDGLQARFDAWEATANFLEFGSIEEDQAIEECSSADEARAIASHYNEIINIISGQMDAQKG